MPLYTGVNSALESLQSTVIRCVHVRAYVPVNPARLAVGKHGENLSLKQTSAYPPARPPGKSLHEQFI